MILSAKAIQKEIAAGRIRIEPSPYASTGFDTDSVNVHMGDRLYEWRPRAPGMTTSLRLGAFKYRDLEKDALIELLPDGDHVITMRPGKFYQADLLEYIALPDDICAHVEGKSSLARIGLQVHVTAPHAHAGWEGRLKLEMIHHGPFNLEITSGFEIGQLFFYRIEDPETGPVHGDAMVAHGRSRLQEGIEDPKSARGSYPIRSQFEQPSNSTIEHRLVLLNPTPARSLNGHAAGFPAVGEEAPGRARPPAHQAPSRSHTRARRRAPATA